MVMLRRVLVVLQVNSLKMLHWLGPAVSAWEDQVPGTDFLSWIRWDRDLQVFPIHLGWQKNKLEETWPTCVNLRTVPGACFDLPWESSAPAGGILGHRRLMVSQEV